MLNTSNIWLADGTFKTAPNLFYQLYVIHALKGGPNILEDGHLLPDGNKCPCLSCFQTNQKIYMDECGSKSRLYVLTHALLI